MTDHDSLNIDAVINLLHDCNGLREREDTAVVLSHNLHSLHSLHLLVEDDWLRHDSLGNNHGLGMDCHHLDDVDLAIATTAECLGGIAGGQYGQANEGCD